MANFGNLSLSLAFTFTFYGVIALFSGTRFRKREVAKSGRYAVYTSLFFVSCAGVSLLYLLASSDFQVAYVADYTNRSLPMFYKLAAFWGGQKGSLLLWTWILATYGGIVAFKNRHRHGDLIPYTLAIITLTSLFFLILNKFVANPFDVLTLQQGEGQPILPYLPPDGRGLNPLLQHPVMVIHPPVLYLGFVGFVVPFAFAIAALITKEPETVWLRLIRRWTLASWFFLGSGILLGANWAYAELGWGGYWSWDPVENASLIPWLTGTAFLHSVIVQERRGMLRVWNISLIIATYLLCIFGTFLTRSGVVSSVHAFAESPIGLYFIGFLVLMGILSLCLLVARRQYLRSEAELDSLVSRESSLVFNNIILIGAAFAVLWGTMFPLISETIQGERITLGPPFFNKVNIPVGLLLLFLTGVGPLLAWRRTSARSLRKNFLLPVVFSVIVAIVLFTAGLRSIYPLLSFSLSALVLASVVSEFYLGSRARMRMNGERFIQALARLALKNKRRYGGYIVHLGVVMLFVGFTGSAFNVKGEAELMEGETATIKDYELLCTRVEEGENPNFIYTTAILDVYKDGSRVCTMRPEKRFYLASEQSTLEVAIKGSLKEDLYVVFSGMDEERAVIEMQVNPLVAWIWIGGLVLALGTLFIIFPDAKETRIHRISEDLEKMLRISLKA